SELAARLAYSLLHRIAAQRIADEHHEAATACAVHLPSEGTGPERGLVQLVDARVRDSLGHLTLALPGQMKQFAELAEVADEQGPLHVLSEDLQPVHCVDALGSTRLVVSDLSLDDLIGEMPAADVGEYEAVLELPHSFRSKPQGHHEHAPTGVKFDQVESPERGRVLILLSAFDANLEPLDTVREVGNLIRVDGKPKQIREAADERDGDGG